MSSFLLHASRLPRVRPPVHPRPPPPPTRPASSTGLSRNPRPSLFISLPLLYPIVSTPLYSIQYYCIDCLRLRTSLFSFLSLLPFSNGLPGPGPGPGPRPRHQAPCQGPRPRHRYGRKTLPQAGQEEGHGQTWPSFPRGGCRPSLGPNCTRYLPLRLHLPEAPRVPSPVGPARHMPHLEHAPRPLRVAHLGRWGVPPRAQGSGSLRICPRAWPGLGPHRVQPWCHQGWSRGGTGLAREFVRVLQEVQGNEPDRRGPSQDVLRVGRVRIRRESQAYCYVNKQERGVEVSTGWC